MEVGGAENEMGEELGNYAENKGEERIPVYVPLYTKGKGEGNWKGDKKKEKGCEERLGPLRSEEGKTILGGVRFRSKGGWGSQASPRKK